MTLEELKEQIQEDLIICLESKGIDSIQTINVVCQILVDNFKKFKE